MDIVAVGALVHEIMDEHGYEAAKDCLDIQSTLITEAEYEELHDEIIASSIEVQPVKYWSMYRGYN